MPELERYSDHDHAHAKGIFDPSCEDEQSVLMATLASFYLYRRAAHYTFTHRRRRNFYSLPRAQQDILKTIGFQPTLDKIDECIERNATFAEALLKSGCDSFGIEVTTAEQWKHLADSGDMDKARSTLKQFMRDWSAEGAQERQECYGPILDAIDRLFGRLKPRCDARVLVPGAGLGRLAFEICRQGYACEGNEFSYHQLVASNFVLNNTTKADEFTIHPFCLSFSHHRSRDNQLRAITIPDVYPAAELNKPLEFEVPEGAHRRPAIYRYRPSQYFSMSAGEFVESYNNPGAKDSFDCVVTCFFIDTARNLLDYLETISNVLVTEGAWVNYGPLLWHWEGADATENKDGDGGRKNEVKSFEAVESGVEDAEAPQLPPGSNLDASASHTHTHAHSHDGDQPHTHPHNHSHSSEENAHSHANNGPEWRGSLEFTLEEVVQLAKLYGFEFLEQKTGKTGYIEDEKCMGRYIYEPEFWIAKKTDNVSEVVKASLRNRYASEEEREGDKSKEAGEGKLGDEGEAKEADEVLNVK